MIINEEIKKRMNLLKEQIGRLYQLDGEPNIVNFKNGKKIIYTITTETNHQYEIVFYFYPSSKTYDSILRYYPEGLEFINSRTNQKNNLNVCAIWFKNISKGLNRSKTTQMWEYARLYNTVVSLIKKVLRNKTSIRVVYFSGSQKRDDGTMDRENLGSRTKIYRTLAQKIKPEGWEYFQFDTNLVILVHKTIA